MRTQDAKKLPLRDLLSRLGHEPVSEKAGDVWYLSPFHPETKPSFHIHEARNVWFDFSLGGSGGRSGGNVLDFVMCYFQVQDVGSALRHLDELYGGKPITVSPQKQEGKAAASVASAPEVANDHGTMQVQKVQPLQHWGLLDYIKKRGVDPSIARMYLKEIYYTVREGQPKPYFALAFPNRTADGKEGYEIRNAYVKGCIGKKDLSLIKPSQQNLFATKPVLVFEGIFDYLSLLTLQKKRQLDMPVIVLNGIPMGERAIELIREMGAAEVHLYLDHDAGGRDLTARFQRELEGVQFTDASRFYDGYKDINAYLEKQRQTLLAL